MQAIPITRCRGFMATLALIVSLNVIAAPAAESQGTDGLDPFWKDVAQTGAWSVAIVGGLIAAAKAIHESRLNREQRDRALDEAREARAQRNRDLRWRQAQVGTELVDKALNDPQAWDAAQMIDWEDREFKISDGTRVTVTLDDVARALRPYRDKCDLKDAYIREAFDALFYRYSSFERALNIDLVTFDDVATPAQYYIREMSKRRSVYEAYMSTFGFAAALRFANRFESWKAASASGTAS